MGSASAIAGSARYGSNTTNDVVSPDMTGTRRRETIRVRAARSSSANDVTSGGTETQTSDSARATRGRAIASAAGDDAGRHADERRQSQRRHAEQRGSRRALGDELPHGPAVLHRIAQIESRGAAQPLDVSNEQRPIES